MYFRSKELMQLIENQAAYDDAQYFYALKKLLPNKDYSIFEFQGGSSLFLGSSPFSVTHGFGTDESQHNQELLNSIEDFYKINRFPSTLAVATCVDNNIWKILKDYHMVCTRNVY